MLFCCISLLPSAQTTFRLNAFERSYIDGMAPTPAIEIGGKEIPSQPTSRQPEYFIYLLNKKHASFTIASVWIKKQWYPASIKKLGYGPVLIDNITMKKDTLIANREGYVWQIKITGKSKKAIAKKDLSKLVNENELVIKLHDRQGRHLIRSVKTITRLEPERGQ